MLKSISQLHSSIVLAVVIGLTACHANVSSHVRKAFPPEYRMRGPVTMTVSSFQDGKPMPLGSSFAVYTPKELEGDLEFKEYAELLSAFLVRLGYRPTSVDKADYSLILFYDIDQGRTEVTSRSFPTYGMISGGTTQYHSGSIYNYSTGSYATYSGTTTTPPVYGQTGTATSVRSHRVYKRAVEIDVVDLAASKAKKSVAISSTVKIASEGSTGVLRQVMPLFLDSAVRAIGRSDVHRQTADSVPFFSASDAEAEDAVQRVSAEDYGDLLIFSAQNGDYLTTKVLLRKGVDPNTRGGKGNRSALEWAVYSKNKALVHHLLEMGAKVDDGAIDQARKRQQKEVLVWLNAAQHQQQTATQGKVDSQPVREHN